MHLDLFFIFRDEKHIEPTHIILFVLFTILFTTGGGYWRVINFFIDKS